MVLLAGLPEQPGRDLSSPVGLAPVLRVLLIVVAVGGQLHLHDVVDVQAEVRERLGGAADVAFVVRPLRLVLVAAQSDVADDDMVVTAQVHHVQEVLQVQRDGGAGGDLREIGVGEFGADLGHGPDGGSGV
ncbi:hypothetical protein ACFUV1_08790 [Streptomyces griseoincarnatus]